MARKLIRKEEKERKRETRKRRDREEKREREERKKIELSSKSRCRRRKKEIMLFFFHLNKHISLTWYTSYNELWNNRKHLSKHHHELTIFSNPRPPFSYENLLFFSQILLSLLLEYDEVGQK